MEVVERDLANIYLAFTGESVYQTLCREECQFMMGVHWIYCSFGLLLVEKNSIDSYHFSAIRQEKTQRQKHYYASYAKWRQYNGAYPMKLVKD